MSRFECLVEEVRDVRKHPNADRLSILKINDYQCISGNLEDGSPRYKIGDMVVYIPEDSLIPDWLLKKLDFWKDGKGTLSGNEGRRVKAAKLRGEISQGVLYPVEEIFPSDEWVYFVRNEEIDAEMVVQEKDDVSKFLGITKYEPVIPSKMSGDLIYIGPHNTFKYDIENIKKWNVVVQENEEVVLTEKIHGTFAAIGISNVVNDQFFEKRVWIASKGLGQQGLVFVDSEKNKNENLYVKTAHDNQLQKKILDVFSSSADYKSLIIFGEVYGVGVQDLNYETTKPQFRLFDIQIDGKFLSFNEMQTFANEVLNIPIVPIIYSGPFNTTALQEATTGKSTMTNNHIREGVVVRLKHTEREFHNLGRVILKSINEDYLLRKNGTEYQ